MTFIRLGMRRYFAADIAKKGGKALERPAADPTKKVEPAIEELVKWKTAIHCGHSHDVFKGYFIDAESHMELQWNQIIFPLIRIRDLDFTTVLDLACGTWPRFRVSTPTH